MTTRATRLEPSLTLLALAGALCFAGCVGPAPQTNPQTNNVVDAGPPNECAEDDLGQTPEECRNVTPPDPPEVVPCPSAGGINFERPKPNVMFLVDRSGSMAEPGACAEERCDRKWDQLLSLGGYLATVKNFARLGLSVFPAPGGDGCNVSSGVMVPLTDAVDVDDAILTALGNLGPDGRTPISAALDEAALNGGLNATDRDNIIVLLTDGSPNCACQGDAACERQRAIESVQQLVNREIPIRLYVVGFGASGAAAGEVLTAMAETAGTALAGPVKYYQADRVEDLAARLFQLATDLPCRFNLDELPEPADLQVHVDDELVAACTAGVCSSGYTYDQPAGVVELHGSTCQGIRDGQCHAVYFDSATE